MQPAVGCYNSWANLRCSSCYSLGEKYCETVQWSCVCLTHWGRVTHISVSRLTIIGSDNGLSPNIGSENGLSPNRHQFIIWTKVGTSLIGPWEQTSVKFYYLNVYIFIQENAFENVVWEIAAILFRLQSVISIKIRPQKIKQSSSCVHIYWDALYVLNLFYVFKYHSCHIIVYIHLRLWSPDWYLILDLYVGDIISQITLGTLCLPPMRTIRSSDFRGAFRFLSTWRIFISLLRWADKL